MSLTRLLEAGARAGKLLLKVGKLGSNRVVLYLCYFIRLASAMYHVYISPRHSSASNVIVSLTSYGKRLNKVSWTILSLLDQTVRPAAIVLYLDEQTDLTTIPRRLARLEGRGLIIRAGVENLRPHNKYYYAFEEFKDQCIITVDDDGLYKPDLCETLVNGNRSYPNDVIARRVHLIRRSDDGAVQKYHTWGFECKELVNTPSEDLLATGVGGVLYPPGKYRSVARDREAIIRYALNADDIWLKFVECRTGVRVVYVPNRQNHPLIIPGSQGAALHLTNVIDGGNDEVFDKLNAVYRAFRRT